jgi:hypothetical protein
MIQIKSFSDCFTTLVIPNLHGPQEKNKKQKYIYAGTQKRRRRKVLRLSALLLYDIARRAARKGWKLRLPTPFIGDREREGVGGPTYRRRGPVTHWSGWTMVRSPSPTPGCWPVALGRCFKPGVSLKWYGPHGSPVLPTHTIFLLFQN